MPGSGARRALARRAFGEFYQQFGGQMRLLITGMAPIKRSVARFFGLMQLPLSESYGLVETGSLTYRPPGSRKYGSVGKPVRGVAIELADDGEVIVCRDTFLTRRYFQCSEGENERTFIGSDCVATGDVGRFDADGYLYLMGRKKEVIVTPGGYKIHPEGSYRGRIEMASRPDVAQSVILSAARGAAHLVAVVLAQPGEKRHRPVSGPLPAQLPSARKAVPISEFILSDAPFSVEERHVAAQSEGRPARHRRELQIGSIVTARFV